MTITITMLARKGGVGRTTLTCSMAGELGRRGARVLCIDVDGQASLSRVFFGSAKIEQLDPSETVAAVMANYGSEVDEVIHQTAIENIAVLPACDALEKLAVPEVGENVTAIRDVIMSVADRFDVVLIDTPPNTNVATSWAAVVASDYVISPVPADAFGTQSIISVQRTVGDAVALNPNVRILGYVLNQVQRNGVNDAYVAMVRQLHGSQVFATEVPLAVAFREAMSVRTPISHHKPRSKASKVIASLVDEINERIESLAAGRAA